MGLDATDKELERAVQRHRAMAVFRPIVGVRAATEVADQLTFAVMSGLYQPGEYLPTIDEMAEAMRVSRPTVGDAVHMLVEGGVLEVRRGAKGGVYVLTAAIPPSLMKLSRLRRGRTLAEAVEARRPVEVALVRFAAVRRTSDDLDRLEAASQLLGASADKPREWTQANNLFHATIGRAAGNALLGYVQHELQEEIELLLDGYNKLHADPARTIREHRSIVAALRSANQDEAEAAMDKHLRALEDLAPEYDEHLAEVRSLSAIAPQRRRPKRSRAPGRRAGRSGRSQ